MAKVTITAPEGEAIRPLTVNGRNYPYQYGKPVSLPASALAALRNSNLTFTVEDDTDEESPALTATEGNGDAGSDDTPGGLPVAASDTETEGDEKAAQDDATPDDFDPEAVIKGTVADVSARLETLTLEQLEAVKAAEADREQPRVGVSRALDNAIAAFTAPE